MIKGALWEHIHVNIAMHVCLHAHTRIQYKDTIQGYKDTYLPKTFKCTQELVLVTIYSYSVLTKDKTLQLAMYKSYT